ncbi:enoyl-CoA hydratase [Sneathiella sp. HT1-7]|jgi:enoyl-CoA hydratase/carnithine racemase|uniref:enoyl-CoA hydratase n=1 Tax=Sneathiella sp. HT1-7 TaxID=2887192 RepID=UPI001D144AB9|nr:enoyl-CoA hydratase [Sneathiella sp. HT1-7]MCC3304173.1 enoyl-CoA hydratase/isomerase family protein [Sneathiella sp. HT1-7]
MTKFVRTDLEDTPEGKIARVTIDNQRKLNTLNSIVIGELNETLTHLDKDTDIGILILTGAGNKSFIGGADISEMAGLNPDTARTFITNMHHACHKVRYFHAPVVARVNGFSLGAGMELAAACDMIIACKSAQFAMPEVRVGIPSVIDAALLPQILGFNLARDLVLTGRSLSATEARDAGLVQRLVEDDALDAEVDKVIAEILDGGRNAMAIQKQLCNDWENNPLRDGIQLGIEAFAHSYESEEPHKMMEKFLNRPR